LTASRRNWRIAAAGWALVIALSGLLPTQDAVHSVAWGRDDVATTAGHFFAYALLGFLLPVALGGREIRARALAWSLVLAAGLGVAIEVVQGPLPYRDAQLVDALVDIAGAALGAVLISAVALSRRPRSRRG
jgi:VanZ family protein